MYLLIKQAMNRWSKGYRKGARKASKTPLDLGPGMFRKLKKRSTQKYQVLLIDNWKRRLKLPESLGHPSMTLII